MTGFDRGVRIRSLPAPIPVSTGVREGASRQRQTPATKAHRRSGTATRIQRRGVRSMRTFGRISKAWVWSGSRSNASWSRGIASAPREPRTRRSAWADNNAASFWSAASRTRGRGSATASISGRS